MSSKIITRPFKTSIIEKFIASVGSTIEDSVYYIFYGDHITKGDTEEDINQIEESVESTRINPYRKMIAGKQLNSENVAPMIRRHRWESNRTFAMYDDTNANLYNEAFYVTVEGAAESDVHVYKCLFNNNDGLTSEEPNILTVIGNGDEYYETSDGYQWKYMYSIPSSTFRNFKTQKFIPVVDYTANNNNLVKNIVPGSIDVIQVDDPGANYNNYYPFGTFEGKFEDPSDIAIGAQGRVYAIRSPGVADNFYANTIMSLTLNTGSGDGSFRRIESSSYNPVTNRVELTLDDAFEITPDTTTLFEISPEVRVFGNDSETVKAVGRAVINTVSNSVSRVEMLSVGENYDYAIADVLQGGIASSSGGTVGTITVRDAKVRPIVSPKGGHGSDPAYELGATALGVSIRLSNTEPSSPIPAENTFAQIGIIENPEFSNIKVGHKKVSDNVTAGADGEFVIGEEIIQFNKLPVCGNVNVIIGANNTFDLESPVGFNGIEYDDIIRVGELVYIRDDRDLEQRHHIGEVLSVSAGSITVKGTPIWSENITLTYNPANPLTIPNTQLFLVREISRGVVRDVDSTREFVSLRNVKRPMELDKIIIGTESFTVATTTSINTNDRFPGGQYNFSTFIQATRCVGSTTGTFSANEIVEQKAPGALLPFYTAEVHSQPSSGELLLTNTVGQINTTLPLIGKDSNVQMNQNFNKYEGDLDAVTGEILFLENNIPVERSNTESEQLRIILEF